MSVIIRAYQPSDVDGAIQVWNEVVEDGVAFPQEERLDKNSGNVFFQSQSFTAVACDTDTDETVGLYILHPNNIGRCGHICNASFAVKRTARGQHIGERLVMDCKCRAKELGFQIMQFNAVVASNHSALHLYRKLGFVRLGTIPQGFRLENGEYEDIILHYCIL